MKMEAGFFVEAQRNTKLATLRHITEHMSAQVFRCGKPSTCNFHAVPMTGIYKGIVGTGQQVS